MKGTALREARVHKGQGAGVAVARDSSPRVHVESASAGGDVLAKVDVREQYVAARDPRASSNVHAKAVYIVTTGNHIPFADLDVGDRDLRIAGCSDAQQTKVAT